ncbi:6-phosphofructokinase 4 [Morus notabilis]|uniref:6-phosphofructokinase 4 n=1 Tax=Morus notabilis TaxID=981085 RepID=W9R5A3_9ROSA|nr:6-phosphofructokinase 4 [Morus notabilis]
MEFAVSSGLSKSSPSLPLSIPTVRSKSKSSTPPYLPNPFFKSRSFLRFPLFSRQNNPIRCQSSYQTPDDGFVLEDVPHLTNFLPDLPSYPNPLQNSQAYAIVKETFVSPEDVVAERIVVRKDSPRGVHFRRAGPREKVYCKSDEVRACIVTCGGLCPGINTVIREVVCGLNYMYGVSDILGIEGGYRGFYSRNTLRLTPKVVNDIHKRGGTFLRTSRGGHDTQKILDNIQDRGINQEVEKRGLHVAVAGIPKTIDNDIADHFTKVQKMAINMKYIGIFKIACAIFFSLALLTAFHFVNSTRHPTYMIRAIPSNASDNIYCTLLAQSAVHGAMAGYSGFTVGPVNSRHAYIPISRVTETQNTVKLTGRTWARLLASTNQPSFLDSNEVSQKKIDGETIDVINNNTSIASSKIL